MRVRIQTSSCDQRPSRFTMLYPFFFLLVGSMSVCLGAGDLEQVVHCLGSSVACSTSDSDTLGQGDNVDSMDLGITALHNSLGDCEFFEFDEAKLAVDWDKSA
jgi:hypothetical protein